MLAPYLGHFFFVGRYPDRSALVVFDVGGQFRSQLLPEPLRVPGQGKLRCGVVHHYDVPHPGSRGAAAHDVSVNDRDEHAASRKFVGTRRTDDSSAHNNHVISCGAHAV